MSPKGTIGLGGPSRDHVEMPPYGRHDLVPRTASNGAGWPGADSGTTTPGALVPPLMGFLYASRRSPCSFPTPAWALGPCKTEAPREPPRGFTGAFDNNSHRVQPLSLGHDYANHEPQVNQAAAMAVNLRTMAPPQADGMHWGCAGGSLVLEPPPHHVAQGAAMTVAHAARRQVLRRGRRRRALPPVEGLRSLGHRQHTALPIGLILVSGRPNGSLGMRRVGPSPGARDACEDLRS